MEKHYNYIILRQAKSDIDNIFGYITDVLLSESSAFKLIDAFQEKFNLACTNPKMYPKIANSLVKNDIRRIIISSYVLVYRIIKTRIKLLF